RAPVGNRCPPSRGRSGSTDILARFLMTRCVSGASWCVLWHRPAGACRERTANLAVIKLSCGGRCCCNGRPVAWRTALLTEDGAVFENLVESNRKRQNTLGQQVVSLALHAGLIFGAIQATRGAAEAVRDVVVDTTMVFLKPP